MQGSALQRLSEYSPGPSVRRHDAICAEDVIEEEVSRETVIKNLAAYVNEVTFKFNIKGPDFQCFISELVLCPTCGGVKSAGCCEYAEEGLFD